MNNSLAVSLVISGLIAIALISVGGIVALAYLGKTVPDSLTGLAAGSAGALSSMLASTRATQGGGTQDVMVVNKPNDPVPTTEASP